jgi:hypothetical protein
MNSTTFRRTIAAWSVVVLAVSLCSCAGVATAPGAGEPRARAASVTVVTSAMHRALVQSAADRYVVELLVRARMVTHPVAPIVRQALTPVRLVAHAR